MTHIGRVLIKHTFVAADISMLSLEGNSVLSKLTFQHSKYDFKTLKFKIAKNRAKMSVYSAVSYNLFYQDSRQ